MNNLLSNIARNIEPYVPGEQIKGKKYIKLNANENPYPPSPMVIDKLRNFDYDKLKLYPDSNNGELKTVLSEYYNLEDDQIFIGNGSDEILAMSYLAFFNKGDEIIFPDITFSFYPIFAKLFEISYRCIPLDNNFNININEYLAKNDGIIIANPNAPTGIYLEIDKIKIILEKNQNSIVIVDEAYIDYGGESCKKLIDEYNNLLVITTLSKSRSLAGMRIGLAFGNSELINGLDRIKNSFNSYTVNIISQEAAKYAFIDDEYFRINIEKIINTRENVIKALKELDFNILNSSTNFILIEHKNYEAKEIFQKLKSRGVVVRYFNIPRINNFLRISIGTDIEMDEFLDNISKIICSK